MTILKNHSSIWLLFYLLLSAVAVMPIMASAAYEEQSDWQAHFDKYHAKGTIVVLDKRDATAKAMVLDNQRAHKRYSPASTFKIPHSLFALDSNLVKDEFQVFNWDGIERSYSPHNQDQNLRSAMRSSAVWVYDEFAKQLGESKAQNYLSLIDYGNADPSFEHSSTDGSSYWIDGKLAISAAEQVEFLQKLYRNQLPFELAAQLLVKDIMIVEAGRDWILRAKTGWQGQHGWWVGWVEWPTGPVFFALNIDTPNRMQDLYKREAIVREVLQSIDALPAGQ
ncbi:Beta-lactamase [Shewanella pealeana ATCC 700345]|uniref:Beta-lactamase n=2 Tax=Shewanella pealeana TaxID=70864 RepID=A8H5X0_SHEPA|nr:Beta-lactamase [Shewanella pealeana ATCC 700345]